MTAEPDVRTVPTVQAAWAATLLFTVTQIVGTVSPDGTPGLVAQVTSLVLFGVGSLVFVGAFVVAAGRSRDERITIAGVVWLTGAAPATVAWFLRGALVVQCAVALVTAGIRPFTAVAFGILAPMFGLGSLAWYGARHGAFAPIGPAAPTPEKAAPAPVAVGNDDERDDPDDFDQLFRRRRRGRRGDG